jgi:hypothetical protein
MRVVPQNILFSLLTFGQAAYWEDQSGGVEAVEMLCRFKAKTGVGTGDDHSLLDEGSGWELGGDE